MDTNDDLNGSKNRKNNNNIHTLSKTTEYLKKLRNGLQIFSIIEMTLSHDNAYLTY